jgi:hypothetical protein
VKGAVTVLVLLVALARLAQAHSLPIDPSVCAFEPLELAAPAPGLVVVAAPPTDADRFRIVYDPAPSLLQVCGADPVDPANRCADAPPRGLSGAGVDATIDLALFQGRLTAAGDVTVVSAPLTITLGGETATLAVPLTTGLVAVDSVLEEGSAIAADGTFTLVGVATTPALPVPLGGTPLLVRMTCRASPPPDLDQFTAAATTRSFGGKMNPTVARLKAVVERGAVTPDLSLPTLVRLSVGGTTVASVSLPGGLAPAGGRKFTGASADGLATVTVRSLRGGARDKVSLRLPAPVLPATSETRVDVRLTTQLGGVLARGTRAFRVKPRGLRAP